MRLSFSRGIFKIGSAVSLAPHQIVLFFLQTKQPGCAFDFKPFQMIERDRHSSRLARFASARQNNWFGFSSELDGFFWIFLFFPNGHNWPVNLRQNVYKSKSALLQDARSLNYYLLSLCYLSDWNRPSRVFIWPGPRYRPDALYTFDPSSSFFASKRVLNCPHREHLLALRNSAPISHHPNGEMFLQHSWNMNIFFWVNNILVFIFYFLIKVFVISFWLLKRENNVFVSWRILDTTLTFYDKLNFFFSSHIVG